MNKNSQYLLVFISQPPHSHYTPITLPLHSQPHSSTISPDMSKTVTYWENGIKVTKVTNTNGTTSTTYSSSNHTSSHHSPSPPKYDDSDDEEKTNKTTLRRHFFEALIAKNKMKCSRLYDIAMNNPNQGIKIFGPMVSDYTISLSLCYSFRNQRVISIDEDTFKMCWLMHYCFWKKYSDKPVTYVYVTDEERETAHRLGYHQLLKFIDDHHIQNSVPRDYHKCYGEYITYDYVNEDVGDNDVILAEYGTPPILDDITTLQPIKQTYHAAHAKWIKHQSRASTYGMYSDGINGGMSTEDLFTDHQKKLLNEYGTGIDTDISKMD